MGPGKACPPEWAPLVFGRRQQRFKWCSRRPEFTKGDACLRLWAFSWPRISGNALFGNVSNGMEWLERADRSWERRARRLAIPARTGHKRGGGRAVLTRSTRGRGRVSIEQRIHPSKQIRTPMGPSPSAARSAASDGYVEVDKTALFQAQRFSATRPVRRLMRKSAPVWERPKPPSNPPCSACANVTARFCAR
jgi:hypothetical protein